MKTPQFRPKIVWLCCLFLAGPLSTLAAEEPVGETVELPPFTVTGIAINMGPPWRYASIPGFEIITQCPDDESREVIAALWRGPQLALPPDMRPIFSLPQTVVLFNQPGATSPGSFDSVKAAHEIHSHWTNVIKRSVDDRESFALNLFGSSFTYSAAFRFDMRTLLRCRVPAPPAFLNEGLFGTYGVYREGVYWEAGDIKRVHLAAWCSSEEIAQARGSLAGAKVRLFEGRAAQGPSPLISFIPDLAKILEQPLPTDETAGRWASTAALFVRWGEFSRRQGNRERFWRFARLASEGPVTEQLFKDCFGLSYAEVRNELSWYLAYALANRESIQAAVTDLPKFKFREATHAEVARIRGEWERIEAAALKRQYPDIARRYEDQARRTFERTYAAGNRDPRLLAGMGLLAKESGAFAEAHEWLKAAAAGGVKGPSPYVELAQLRWAHDMTDDQGTLPAEDRAAVWDILLKAEKEHPRLASVYLLGAKLLLQNKTLSAEERDFLDRGLLAFPKHTDLRKRVDAVVALSASEPAAENPLGR